MTFTFTERPVKPPPRPQVRETQSVVNFWLGQGLRLTPPAEGRGAPEPDSDIKEGVIKGNQSGIYHTPDSPNYKQCKAEVLFDTEEEAQAAGFRRWGKQTDEDA